MDSIFHYLFGFKDEEENSSSSLISKTSSPPELSSLTIQFLSTHTRLFSVIPNLSIWSESVSKETETVYSLIKGAIQSGKSEIIHALSLYFTIVLGETVVILLRDFIGDYDQMDRGLERFLGSYKTFLLDATLEEDDIDLPLIHYMGDVHRTRDGHLHGQLLIQQAFVKGSIIVALSNADQMRKLNECHVPDHRFHIIIDESDQLMFSEGIRFTPQLDMLTSQACNVVGISATHYEHFHDVKDRFHTSRTFVMAPPPASIEKGSYKGILDIQFEYIQPINTKLKKESENILRWDTDLCEFLKTHETQEPFHIHGDQKHPMMTLIKHERMVTQQNKMLEHIRSMTSAYTIIVYNGTEVVLYSPSLAFTTIILPTCQKRENKTKSTNGLHVFKQVSIVYVLQYLKDNGGADRFSRILIIAHGLVGRGIQIVSEDYGWHLTHMFYRPSSSTRASAYLQDMRLCGIYRDTIPLTCMLEQKVYENLYKSYMLQEDLFQRISNETSEPMKRWLVHQRIFQEKFPKCKATKTGSIQGIRTNIELEDQGMSMAEFNRPICITKMNRRLEMSTTPTEKDKDSVEDLDKKEWDRLTNPNNGMFQKWARDDNTSAIARFMRNGLDPRKRYTKKEMLELCGEYRLNLSDIIKLDKKEKTHYLGSILVKQGQLYSLHPQLLESFERYF